MRCPDCGARVTTCRCTAPPRFVAEFDYEGVGWRGTVVFIAVVIVLGSILQALGIVPPVDAWR